MARWRLKAPHYLSIQNSEWQYIETDLQTGRQLRKTYAVPALLDPNSPGNSQERPNDGGTGYIVAYEGKGQPGDYIFSGDPTPDMEPVDEEATIISNSRREFWKHPIDDLPVSYSQSLLNDLQRQIADLAIAQPVRPTSLKGVDPDAFTQLQEQVQELMAANAELQGKLAEKNPRRV